MTGSGGSPDFDVVLAGGGLASGLVVLALRRRRPGLRIALCEAGEALGGNHTWSFHSSDVDDEAAALLEPLLVRRWPAVAVRFPDHQRALPLGYATLTSSTLDRAVRAALAVPGSRLLLGRRAAMVTAHEVVLGDGERLRAPLVLDGRGPAPTPGWYESCAFQKFVGLELTVDPAAAAAAFAPEQALVMDATVPQHDGFRFVYVLPLAPDRLLVEDTYYSDEPALDRPTLRARIGGYLAQRGVHPLAVLREEAGVLPLPMADSGVPPLGSPVRLGARGGWLHPTTGYTLPLAVRVALIVAGTGGQADDAISALARHHRQHARQAHFFRRLNRLLFRAVAPQRRWQMLSRFYRLPPVTIARFYAADTTPGDRARILVGRPPRGVSLPAAFAALQAA